MISLGAVPPREQLKASRIAVKADHTIVALKSDLFGSSILPPLLPLQPAHDTLLIDFDAPLMACKRTVPEWS